MARILIIVVPLFIFFLHTVQCHQNIYPDCGIREVDEAGDDPRTKSPWSAVIYLRNKFTDGAYIDWTSGIIIGPYTVLTRGRNFWEAETDGNSSTRIRMHGFKPLNFIVGVGLKSRKLHAVNNQDKFTQFHQVKYIRPFYKSHMEHSDFDFTLIQLKTPINFSSTRVRPICVPEPDFAQELFFYLPHLRHLLTGFRYHEKYTLAGTMNFKLNVTTDFCESDECLRMAPKSTNDNFANHGPPCMQTYGKETSLGDSFLVGGSLAAEFRNKWYLIAMVTKSYGCHPTYKHFLSAITIPRENLVWLQQSVKNGPDVYTCSDGKPILLTKVCNGRRDCFASGDDEDFAFCDAWRCPPNSLNQFICDIPDDFEQDLSAMSGANKFEKSETNEETTVLPTKDEKDDFDI